MNNITSLTSLWKMIHILGTILASCVKNHYLNLVWIYQFHLMPFRSALVKTMISPCLCHMFFRPLSYPPSLMKMNNPRLLCLSVLSINHTQPVIIFFWPSLNLFHYAISSRKGSEHQIVQNEGSWQHDFYFVIYSCLHHYKFWFALLIATENWAEVFYHILRSWTWDVMASSQSTILNVNLGVFFSSPVHHLKVIYTDFHLPFYCWVMKSCKILL